jgi:8-oxo-dGTP pyrophosphatase MutT (NUDIX family)
VSTDRAHPSEELNSGAETPARVAASVIVLRDSANGPEVLLVQRNPAARFMGGAWVFPGGAVDAGEEVKQTGLRELEEEASLTVRDPDELVPFSRWITPAEVKIRFDTWFFVVRAPEGSEPAVDGSECVDLRWIRPAEALAAGADGSLQLVFPTIKHLEQLELFPSADALIEHARGRVVRPVQPRVVITGETARILLPGDPGYEAEAEAEAEG